MNNLIRLVEGQACIVSDDPWQLDAEADAPLILPLTAWRERQPAAVLEGRAMSADGLLLQVDDEPEALQPFLASLPLIAIDFPSFRDGRGYSQAYLLRTQLGWRGELRAVGDVLRDQLAHMRQCGFDAFAVRADKSLEDALKGLQGLSVLYGRSVIEPRPLFRRGAIRRSRDHDGAWPVLAGIAAVVWRGAQSLAVADAAGLDHWPAAALGLADVARRRARAAAAGRRWLLPYLPLLLAVPASGIMTSSDLLLGELPVIATALVLSLLVTVPFCGWLLQTLIRRQERKG